jgi:hypothetical protein
MIAALLGKATSPSKSPSDPIPEPAIIPLYPHRVRFARQPAVVRKGGQETIPIVGPYRIVGN